MKPRYLYSWIWHPITMIVAVNVAWTVALVFWILFFQRRYNQVSQLAQITGMRVQDLVSYAPLVLGILLLVFIFGITVVMTFFFARQAVANKQMRTFLSVVSHELRTPITSIRLFLETMRDHDVEAEKRSEFIRNMLQDSERLSRQIGGILDATRLDQGTMPIQKRALGLRHFMDEFVQQRRPSVESQGHKLILNDVPDCTISADPDALMSVLDNLVRNAERYSPESTDITLSMKVEGKWAKVTVTDQGIGIDKNARKKIFKPFYRTMAGRSKSSKGTGLGLYIVRGIIALHGGKVTIKGHGEDKGASFTVWLPLPKEKRKK